LQFSQTGIWSSLFIAHAHISSYEMDVASYELLATTLEVQYGGGHTNNLSTLDNRTETCQTNWTFKHNLCYCSVTTIDLESSSYFPLLLQENKHYNALALALAVLPLEEVTTEMCKYNKFLFCWNHILFVIYIYAFSKLVWGFGAMAWGGALISPYHNY
jgi:hypothetical protein